jgi:hypothetical protein
MASLPNGSVTGIKLPGNLAETETPVAQLPDKLRGYIGTPRVPYALFSFRLSGDHYLVDTTMGHLGSMDLLCS